MGENTEAVGEDPELAFLERQLQPAVRADT